jgi:osmotically-inducible protein OsmY
MEPAMLSPQLPHEPTGHRAAQPRAASVAEEAGRALHQDAQLRYCAIACEYRQGTLTLRGRVPSFYLKQVAQTAVRDLSGVEQVVNGIEVVPGTDQTGRDEAAPLGAAR